MASPADSLTPLGSPLPSIAAHASAAASLACTSSKESSPWAAKEGMPLRCCSMGLLGVLGFFQQLCGTELHLVDAALQESRAHEIAEERVRAVGSRAKLRVELARDKPGVVGQLDDLDEPSIGRHAAEHHARFAHHLAVLVVELEAVAMALVHDLFPIRLVGAGAWLELAWVQAEPHR